MVDPKHRERNSQRRGADCDDEVVVETGMSFRKMDSIIDDEEEGYRSDDNGRMWARVSENNHFDLNSISPPRSGSSKSKRKKRRRSSTLYMKNIESGDGDADETSSFEDEHFWTSFLFITSTVVILMVCAVGWTFISQDTEMTEGSAMYDPLEESDLLMGGKEGSNSTNFIIPNNMKGGGQETFITGETSISPSTSRRPPLSALVADLQTSVIGDVQFLMDFAIVGRKYTTNDPFFTLHFHPIEPNTQFE